MGFKFDPQKLRRIPLRWRLLLGGQACFVTASWFYRRSLQKQAMEHEQAAAAAASSGGDAA
jgi:hypothetical protein